MQVVPTARRPIARALYNAACQVRCFPRHACLGLIEARSIMTAPTIVIEFSEARVPRPHLSNLPNLLRILFQIRFPRHACLGLIEAILVDSVRSEPCGVFRGTRASASLKRNRKYSTTARSGSFPRHACLG